jgi:hypothetical protein
MVNNKKIIDERCNTFKSIKAYKEYLLANPSNYSHRINHNYIRCVKRVVKVDAPLLNEDI